VTAERTEFIGEVLEVASAGVSELGVELIDVRVKRIDLPPEVSDSVYNRMRQDFVRQATKLRAEGSETSERLRSEADRERTEILAAAYRDAEIVRGEGDAKAADTYAEAYNRNAEFFAFYRSLEAYRKSLGGENDVLVIAPEGEFFKYFEQAQPR
jgi:membrane protease subunit HflC